jgi:hypothetical protein
MLRRDYNKEKKTSGSYCRLFFFCLVIGQHIDTQRLTAGISLQNSPIIFRPLGGHHLDGCGAFITDVATSVLSRRLVPQTQE